MSDRHGSRSPARRIGLGETEVLLGPGKAFGSGEHETTASCLELLLEIPDIDGASVLDLGCGTGVLGIAALKLGATSVLAIDNDPDAIDTTRANAALNSVTDRVDLLLGTIVALGDTGFDLILANLYGDLIVSALDVIVSHLAAGGSLVLSGIAPEYVLPVKQGLERHGLRIERTVTLEEYTTLLVAHGAATP